MDKERSTRDDVCGLGAPGTAIGWTLLAIYVDPFEPIAKAISIWLGVGGIGAVALWLALRKRDRGVRVSGVVVCAASLAALLVVLWFSSTGVGGTAWALSYTALWVGVPAWLWCIGRLYSRGAANRTGLLWRLIGVVVVLLHWPLIVMFWLGFFGVGKGIVLPDLITVNLSELRILLIALPAIGVGIVGLVAELRLSRRGCCGVCGYSLKGLAVERCPECGDKLDTLLTWRDTLDWWAKPRRRFRARVLLAVYGVVTGPVVLGVLYLDPAGPFVRIWSTERLIERMVYLPSGVPEPDLVAHVRSTRDRSETLYYGYSGPAWEIRSEIERRWGNRELNDEELPRVIDALLTIQGDLRYDWMVWEDIADPILSGADLSTEQLERFIEQQNQFAFATRERVAAGGAIPFRVHRFWRGLDGRSIPNVLPPGIEDRFGILEVRVNGVAVPELAGVPVERAPYPANISTWERLSAEHVWAPEEAGEVEVRIRFRYSHTHRDGAWLPLEPNPEMLRLLGPREFELSCVSTVLEAGTATVQSVNPPSMSAELAAGGLHDVGIWPRFNESEIEEQRRLVRSGRQQRMRRRQVPEPELGGSVTFWLRSPNGGMINKLQVPFCGEMFVRAGDVELSLGEGIGFNKDWMDWLDHDFMIRGEDHDRLVAAEADRWEVVMRPKPELAEKTVGVTEVYGGPEIVYTLWERAGASEDP